MENPYKAPEANDPIQSTAFIADRYISVKGWFSNRLYQGKVYADENEIILIGQRDVSRETVAIQFGLLGYLMYRLFRKKPVGFDLEGLPEPCRQYLESQKKPPLDFRRIPKNAILAITKSRWTGLTIKTRAGKYRLSKGLLGRAGQIMEALRALKLCP